LQDVEYTLNQESQGIVDPRQLKTNYRYLQIGGIAERTINLVIHQGSPQYPFQDNTTIILSILSARNVFIFNEQSRTMEIRRKFFTFEDFKKDK
jgi:hypothetical protein